MVSVNGTLQFNSELRRPDVVAMVTYFAPLKPYWVDECALLVNEGQDHVPSLNPRGVTGLHQPESEASSDRNHKQV
jgi:hypothetical protein